MSVVISTYHSGHFFQAARDQELRDVYERLSSRLGHKKSSREISDVFAGGAGQSGDQRHRAVLNGLWDVGGGVQLSGIYFFGSGERDSASSGAGDLRGLGDDDRGTHGRIERQVLDLLEGRS